MRINQAIVFINKLVDTHPERHYVEAIECIEKELAEALKPSHNLARDEILAPDFDCSLVCINAKKCFQYCIDNNIDIDRGDEGCKNVGGLIRSPVA